MEPQAVAVWLTRIVDWPQGLATLLGPVPGWVPVAVMFAPTALAAVLRSWRYLLAIAMLNALVVLAALSWAPGEIRLLGIGIASALILGLIGAGFRQRERGRAMAQVHARLSDIDTRMSAFLEAVDQRARIVEERAIELAETRVRNSAGPQAKAEPAQKAPTTS